MVRQLIIIGSGPAGFTAAIYAARADLKPLLIASSVEIGGELMNTTEVENYPGFPEGVMGPDLMEKFQAQAERFGTEVVYDDVVSLDLAGDVKKVTLGLGETHEALAVIIATGSGYRKLGLPEEERLSGRGISWCATCDGAFFKQRTIAAIWSRIGETMRHGPHHSAQKSTRTGVAELSTSASKVASVTLMAVMVSLSQWVSVNSWLLVRARRSGGSPAR